MTKVNCTVSSCEFWGRGNLCHAEQILVKNNFSTYSGDNRVEFGEEFHSLPEAGGSSQTLCETMRPKQSDDFDTIFKDTPGLGMN